MKLEQMIDAELVTIVGGDWFDDIATLAAQGVSDFCSGIGIGVNAGGAGISVNPQGVQGFCEMCLADVLAVGTWAGNILEASGQAAMYSNVWIP